MSAENDRPSAGWQQPAVARPVSIGCLHVGALFAGLAVAAHDTGHKWVCTCGQAFVVVSNGGKDKRLVKDWRPRVTPPVDEDVEPSREQRVEAAEDRAEQAAFDAARERS